MPDDLDHGLVRPGEDGLNRRLWLVATTCVLAAYGFATASHFTQGELSLDEALTFFVSIRPLRDVLIVPTVSHVQPPLFYLMLHAWLRLGDTEPVLRVLPLVFMVCAALTLLRTSWLSPLVRAVAAALLLLTPYSDYLTSVVRPYSLSVWFSLWSCLLFLPLLLGQRRRAVCDARYILVTALMAYSLAMTSWVLVAQGLCAAGALAVATARDGFRRALASHTALLLSLAAVAAMYLPYVIIVWRLQGSIGHPSLAATLADAFNPRYYVSGPVYLLALPGGLGYLAVAVAAFGVWRGVRGYDPMVGVLVTVVLVQIALTHGFLAGRSGFSFRYLAPAYPAVCLLAGIGADRLFSRFRAASFGLAASAACVLAASIVSYARAPQNGPIGPWRQLAAEFRRMPGTKIVFFDIGWDAQRLHYEVRDDPDVRIMADPGTGWAISGRGMTPDYVNRTIEQEAGPATRFFYHVDAAQGSRVFDEAFVPAMARHGCARVYERAVPTYVRSDPDGSGARLYGYGCSGA